jgi:hypothetical protein
VRRAGAIATATALLLVTVGCRRDEKRASVAPSPGPTAASVLLVTLDTLRPDALGWVAGNNAFAGCPQACLPEGNPDGRTSGPRYAPRGPAGRNSPLTTSGFAKLEQAVTIPAGVAQVRVKLAGFAPTDLHTAGTVKFEEVGLFGN